MNDSKYWNYHLRSFIDLLPGLLLSEALVAGQAHCILGAADQSRYILAAGWSNKQQEGFESFKRGTALRQTERQTDRGMDEGKDGPDYRPSTNCFFSSIPISCNLRLEKKKKKPEHVFSLFPLLLVLPSYFPSFLYLLLPSFSFAFSTTPPTPSSFHLCLCFVV